MSLNGTAWTPIGPNPIQEGGNPDNGMVTAIAINPNNKNVIYIGTAGGGVWRSRDGGTNWTPLFDRALALGIGEPAGLAIDPNNTDIIYAGTSQRVAVGTGNTGVFGAPDSSQGLYKSTDGGNSWIQLGSGFPTSNRGTALNLIGQSINVVIIDPANSNAMYLASSAGVFFSTDAGQNWTAGNGVSGDARSLVLDGSALAGNRILYAGISGKGVFQSTDGARNWSQILSGSTPAVATAVGPAPKGFNKVIVAIPPPSSAPNVGGVQVIYVTLEGTGTGATDPVGVFISIDQGVNWKQQTATSLPSGTVTATGGGGATQGGYSFHMAIDPASPGDGFNDIIYLGAVKQARSADSGTTFSVLTTVPHADTHAWAFFPQPSPTPTIVYCGDDGGLDVSTNNGGAWKALGVGVQTGLVFNVDIKPDAAGSVIVAALQDNGLLTTKAIASPAWASPQGGDGFDVAYDGVTPGQLYGTSGFWGAPCTRIFTSTLDGTDLSSTVPTPQDITPWGTTSDQNCGVFPVTTDPSTAGIVYVSGNQNLWQLKGGTWRKLAGFAGTGDIDVAAVNGNNVVIGVGGQVFVTTNALAATVTFTNITRNLPGRNVARALFDPIDPTVIYAVLGGLNGIGPGQSGHVFRTTIGGTTWTDISPTVGSLAEQLDLPFNAIALDGTDVPTTIYVGTDMGVLRSVDLGVSWSILDDIHFPRVPVTDLVLNTQAGLLVAGTYGRGVFKFAKPSGPSIAIHLEQNLNFGDVCNGGPAYLNIEVFNVGAADLIVTSVQRLLGSSDFLVLPTPGTPVVIAPGEDIEFTVQFTPSVPGSFETAIIRIVSNDPAAPFVDVGATGFQDAGQVAVAIANSGSFPNTCAGSLADELLTINNSGTCPLTISNITSSSGDFLAPGVLSYPLVVNPGTSIDLTIRFQPSSFGVKSGSITIFSDDPASPLTLPVQGVAPAPHLALAIADTGNFGNCCVGSFKDEPALLNNSGRCTLTVTGIASSSGEFLVPEVLSYPLTIAAGGTLAAPIRFQPTSFGPKSGSITVSSDDPTGPHTITVSGVAPSGKVAVTGSAHFGGVKCGRREFRTIAVCNVGDCDLHVTKVAFERRNRHWRLVHNPFPATLHPGSCLNVVIRYKATQKEPRPCEFVIASDDPVTPVREVEAIAWTVCCCQERCEERHEECCEHCHRECCCERREDRKEECHEQRHEDSHGKRHPHYEPREEDEDDDHE